MSSEEQSSGFLSPVIGLENLELRRWSQGELYAGAFASLGARAGLRRLGVRYIEVPPDKSGCPFHNHSGEDEVFVILEGSGLYRFGEARYPFAVGDILTAPAGGSETAHQIVNTGGCVLRFLAFSANVEAEIVEYPDSGKFLARGCFPDGRVIRKIHKQDAAIDYWLDEPGAI